ncbi:hypothetical protein [Arenicella sp. 4NH20-0111]|uniref:hypothetical protein n=1 Tax=Arenicella sp. 4NH20-0111 TaxID=3127648 RepID=UPI00333E6DD6
MKWSDHHRLKLILEPEELEKHFRGYDEWWYQRAWIANEVSIETAYGNVNEVARILSLTLELPSYLSFRNKSKVIKKYRIPRKVSVSRNAEKQQLGDSKKMGRYCVEVAQAITIERVYGRLPIVSGSLHSQKDDVARLTALPSGLISMINGNRPHHIARAKNTCNPIPKGSELDDFRWGIVRMKLMAEFIIFIFQTGMNVSQTLRLERRVFKYKGQGSTDWRVSVHKPRRQGGVEFTIYRMYRPWFKRYIEFITHFYPDDERLFPLGNLQMSQQGLIKYNVFKKQLAQDGIPWLSPKTIRNTRVNFIDRLAGDPNVSAEMAQHSREVFKDRYELPSQQRALTEITGFWATEPMRSLIQSECRGRPEAIKGKPEQIVTPDCMHESGCLFCKSHRDIKSFDYVWGLITFRMLKIVELRSRHTASDGTVDLIVAKLTDKIEAYRSMNDESRQWVIEGLERVGEGDYHPNWDNILQFWEGGGG